MSQAAPIASDSPVVDLRRPHPRFIERVPIHFARQHALLGVESERKSVVLVACADLKSRSVIDNLALTLGLETRPMVVDRDALQAAINAAYAAQDVDVGRLLVDLNGHGESHAEPLQFEGDLLDRQSRAPVIELVNMVLFEAIQRRASDVHVHPRVEDLLLRLRIDGVLMDYKIVPKHVQEEITSRIKVLGGMDIAEKRLPQDGRATVRIGSRTIDLRIASLPTAYGERVVVRILDKGARLYSLDELGMPAAMLPQFASLIGRAHGIFLMTGPTGSGKSTTLYAALQKIDYRALNVVTLEDPIEYDLPGISQTQINTRKGLTFAAGLRSLLRQDPDVIMVGEIRDQETARLAIQSALTGHLVLSTLHTNDSVGAVARMLDLGLEPYLVADALLGVGAQRLVRLVCPACATAQPLASEQRQALPFDRAVSEYRRGQGCDSCSGTGFRGRVALFELLVVDEAVRALIHQRAPASALRDCARRSGMRSLRAAGAALVASGRTTPDEVLRVTHADDGVSEERTDAGLRL